MVFTGSSTMPVISQLNLLLRLLLFFRLKKWLKCPHSIGLVFLFPSLFPPTVVLGRAGFVPSIASFVDDRGLLLETPPGTTS